MGAPPVDPGVRRSLEAVPAPPPVTAESLAAVRAAQPPRPRPDGEVVHESVIIPGAPPLRLRIHRRRRRAGPAPAILSVHGGGFVVGDATADDPVFERWCRLFDCVGVSVDYRLAPEAPYPGALQDCHRALRWLREQATALGVDPARIGVFGTSAGGGLAAGLSLLVRDRGESQIAGQVLLYPMLDDRQLTTSSQWTDVLRWGPVSNRFGWQSYLGSRYGGPDVPSYAAPARAADVTGLPPTCIVVGTSDGFHDEDVAFAQQLTHAGVPTELHVYAGGTHGFASPTCEAPLADRARRAIDDWLMEHLA